MHTGDESVGGALANLCRAIEVGSPSWSRRTVAYARALGVLWADDRPFGVWMEELESHDRLHRCMTGPIRQPMRCPVDMRECPRAATASIDETLTSYPAVIVGIESAREPKTKK